ncbi:MAG: DUF664 domain-containing protein [Candidatus Saccharimonadales bacterium]
MVSNEMLIDGFGRVRDGIQAAVDSLSVENLSFRPEAKANSIAWLAWHSARTQDSQISAAAGTDQVWLSGGWYDKFGLPFDKKATGYGQTSNEVAAVKVSAELLTAYYDAVYDATIAYLKQLKDADFAKVVDQSWDPPVTLAVRLVSVLSDTLQHAGQAAYIRGLL